MSPAFSEFDEIGYWSEIKLEIVRDYAAAYSKILTADLRSSSYAFAGANSMSSNRRAVPSRALNALPVAYHSGVPLRRPLSTVRIDTT